MTLKNMFLLGSIIGGAYYLSDKTRRDRIFSKLDQLREKLPEWRERAMGAQGSDVQSQGSELGSTGSYGSSQGSGYTGSTGRGTPGNGIY